MAGPGRIEGVFSPYDCVVVGERDTAAPWFNPVNAISSGFAKLLICETSRLLEMTQFWQDLQPKLHPAVPKLRTGVQAVRGP